MSMKETKIVKCMMVLSSLYVLVCCNYVLCMYGCMFVCVFRHKAKLMD